MVAIYPHRRGPRGPNRCATFSAKQLPTFGDTAKLSPSAWVRWFSKTSWVRWFPSLSAAVSNSLTHGFRLRSVFEFAAILIALSFGKGIFQYWMRVVIIGISRDVEYDLRNDLFSHLVTLSSNFYAKYRTGDIMARATNDLNAVRMMLGPGIMYWTETTLTAVLAIAVMLWVDWPLTLIALTPAPLVTLVVVIFGRANP